MTALLLLVTAIIEFVTGVAIFCFPSAVTNFLLSSMPENISVMALERLVGAALMVIGTVNWYVRHELKSVATRGLIKAMLFYNFATFSILAITGMLTPAFHIGTWMAVAIHIIMFAWCSLSLMQE